ncbi:hypothetical protein N6H14_22265 [Paenibacillus sp. CC-CFT747]|nr:hypothetical protein N6H14_22265 [Paenibacillus sp. CC-CFT747]
MKGLRPVSLFPLLKHLRTWRSVLPRLGAAAVYLVFPAVLVAVLEGAARSSFPAAWAWMLERPNEWWMNYFAALGLSLLLAGAVGRTRLAFAALLLAAGTAGFISAVTRNRTGAPLSLWTWFLPQEGRDPFLPLNPPLHRGLLLTAALAAGAILLLLLVRIKPLSGIGRFLGAVAGLVLVTSVWLGIPFPSGWNSRSSRTITKRIFRQPATGCFIRGEIRLNFLSASGPPAQVPRKSGNW